MVASDNSTSFSDDKNKSISPMEERLISALKDGGPLTRDQLSKKLQRPYSTLFYGLRRLIARNEVKKYTFYKTEQCRGRPPVLYSVLDDKK